MTQAVATVRDGHHFQARHFWLRALQLLAADSPLARVGFESGPKGYDDFWVEFKPGRGPNGTSPEPLRKKHFQCKWHVGTGGYGHADLVLPDFINAASYSILERAKNAQQALAGQGDTVRFAFLTNWHIRPEDPLAALVKQRTGELNLDKLFQGGARSANGKLRELWNQHLQLDDAGLLALARTLEFATHSQPLASLREMLDVHLQLHGLVVDPPHQDVCRYDDLVYQWLAAGRLEHDADSLKDALQKQGLYVSRPPPKHFIGVKSFRHPIDVLDERCEAVLDLTEHFADRQVRDANAWAGEIQPKLAGFLIEKVQKRPEVSLVLDAHATLAYAAGATLNLKAGRKIELEQRVMDPRLWNPDDEPPAADWSNWAFQFDEAASSTENELIVAVSLTHDVMPKVLDYANKALGGRPILSATIARGPSNTVVRCGRHAFDLAEALTRKVVAIRKPGAAVHLFIAAPNAFTFFLGQRQPQLGAVTLYEYDFEGMHGAGYSPSLKLPLGPAPRPSATDKPSHPATS